PHGSRRRGGPTAALLVAGWLACTAAPGAAAASTVPAPPAAPAAAPVQEDYSAVAALAQRLAARIVRDGNVPALAVAMVHGDKVLFADAWGVAHSGRSEQVDADTAFRIASLSKGFAGTLAAQLVAEGALRWVTQVSDHLPAFALKDMEGARSLTVEEILSHRVGLPYKIYDRLLE